MVVWQSYVQDGNHRGIFGQRFSAAGAPLGAEFQVNTFTLFTQVRPTVASDASGNFVVTWTSQYQDGPSFGVFGQRFSAAGAPLGAEFRVNTYTTNNQMLSSVASDPSGNFLVVWQSAFQDGGGPGPPGGDFGVFGQNFSAAGAPLGGEFRVNTHTAREQVWPAVAAQGIGKFVVTWDSDMQDGSGWGVFGQRYASVQPTALSVDASAGPTSDGNGVFEAGETVDVAPSWLQRNFGDADLHRHGVDLHRPGRAGRSDVHDRRRHGELRGGRQRRRRRAVRRPPTATRSESPCPARGRPSTGTRASARTISPANLGAAKNWTLHVGDSFADVPRASGFYRFVETLLHHGVTGGCTRDGVLPARRHDARADGGLRPGREGGSRLRPAGLHARRCSTTSRRAAPSAAGSRSWPGAAWSAGAAAATTARPTAVSREQMAVFVLRTMDPASSPPACGTPMFDDVPASSPFCRWIEELARRGVVTGCGGGNYCPTAPVTREQMAVFISATFGLQLYGP